MEGDVVRLQETSRREPHGALKDRIKVAATAAILPPSP